MTKLSILLSTCVLLLATSGCKKGADKNNYINNDRLTAYVVEGISDITITTDSTSVSHPITIKYTDSSQQQVHLSLNGLPAGIVVGNDFYTVGYPTFTTNLSLFDTNYLAPAALGNYPLTLSVSNDNGQLKTYAFNLTVAAPSDSCAALCPGTYATCTDGGGTLHYADTVTADSTIPNKIWFSNFHGSGLKIAAMISNCIIRIPTQVAGGITVSGSGTLSSGYRMKLIVRMNNYSYLMLMN